VRRHTESENLVFLTVLVERVTAVAPMAVYNKQTVHTNSTVLFIRVKLLQPPQTKLVCCPAVDASLNYPFARQPWIPGGYKNLATEDDERWDSPLSVTDALYDRDQVAITLLYLLRIASLLRACEDHLSAYHAHHEARLIKVVCLRPVSHTSPLFC
jgi:hypothetical protein